MDDFEYISKQFIEANSTLLDSLRSKAPQEVNDLLRKIHGEYYTNPFHYAEIQLGIGKYLDFMLDSTTLKSFDSEIQHIAILAYQVLQVYINQCNTRHEDGACMIGGVNYTRINTKLPFRNWPTLPLMHALNFTGKITPYFLPKNKTIYRIIGDDRCKLGHWWLETKPTDRKNWRSDSAVSEQWNKGTRCVELRLNDDLPAWGGIAAIQAVPMSITNCYLKGGGHQIWLDLSSLPLKKPDPNIIDWP